jgi:hypothetical protein
MQSQLITEAACQSSRRSSLKQHYDYQDHVVAILSHQLQPSGKIVEEKSELTKDSDDGLSDVRTFLPSFAAHARVRAPNEPARVTTPQFAYKTIGRIGVMLRPRNRSTRTTNTYHGRRHMGLFALVSAPAACGQTRATVSEPIDSLTY